MKRILCYGDSNTWGHDPENGAKRVDDGARWTRVLQQKLGEDFCVIEEGLCGRRCGGTGALGADDLVCDGYQYFIPCFKSHKPLELVIIMLGTNDLQRQFELQPEYVGEMLCRYVRTIKIISAECGDNVPEILLISPIAIDKAITENPIFNEIFGAQSIAKSERLGNVIEEAAEKCGVHFMRGEDYALASKLDGLHMNAENHRRFGNAVYDRVKTVLKLADF